MPNYDRFAMGDTIDRYVINARYREVLRLKFCEGLTYEQVAESTHYSTQHVKHICKTYKDDLISRI